MFRHYNDIVYWALYFDAVKVETEGARRLAKLEYLLLYMIRNRFARGEESDRVYKQAEDLLGRA